MDKQILNRVESIGSLQEAGGYSTAATTKSSSRLSTKFRVLLLVIGILAVVVGCAVVFAAVGASLALNANVHESDHLEKKGTGDLLIDIAQKEQLLKKAADVTRAKREGRGGQRRAGQSSQITSCYSTQSNGSYPAAHISGRGAKWSALDANSINIPTNGDWNTSWVCANDSDAFVDGGMIFNQTDKKLYVPFCGYYQITSMVYFYVQRDDAEPLMNTSGTYVVHEVIVDRNCNFDDDRVLLRAYGSLLVNKITKIGKVSTQIGDVVKICSGGTIYANIPDERSNPCCPYGRSQTTYLSSFLISKTNCKEPISHPKPPAS